MTARDHRNALSCDELWERPIAFQESSPELTKMNLKIGYGLINDQVRARFGDGDVKMSSLVGEDSTAIARLSRRARR